MRGYLIEVSSPGLDRELKTAKDFIRIKGKRVQVWLTEPVQDKKSFSGDLKDVDIAKGVCTLATKSGDVEIPFAVLHMGKQEFNF
jgi:ribosome maturation factor RimP